MTNQAKIVTEITEILKERFGIALDSGAEEDLTANFFGYKCRMPSYGLLYLMKILEDKYGLRFDDEDFDSPDFYCLGGLAGIVDGKMGDAVWA